MFYFYSNTTTQKTMSSWHSKAFVLLSSFSDQIAKYDEVLWCNNFKVMPLVYHKEKCTKLKHSYLILIRFNIQDIHYSLIFVEFCLIILIIVYKKIYTFNYRFSYHHLCIFVADTCWHHTKTTTQIFSQLLANDGNSEKLWKSKGDFAHVNKENFDHRVSILLGSGKNQYCSNYAAISLVWIDFIDIISIHFSSTVTEYKTSY